MCLTKIPTHVVLKLLSVIGFQNMCFVTCDFYSKKTRIALLGIAVPVLSYKKHPTRSSIVK